MKKFMAILLVLALASLMGLSAMAESVTVDLDDDPIEIPVNATFVPGEVTHVYSVDVSWGSMSFKYTSPAQTWDPATHTYTTSGGGWAAVENSNTVTVENHSDLPVDVAFAFTGEGTVTGEFDVDEDTLAAATAGSSDADSVTATLAITGGTIAASAEIGTATVTISAAE